MTIEKEQKEMTENLIATAATQDEAKSIEADELSEDNLEGVAGGCPVNIFDEVVKGIVDRLGLGSPQAR